MDAQLTKAISVLQHDAASLLLYQSVVSGEIGQAFLNLLQTLCQDDGISCLRAYGKWFTALATEQVSWQDYLITQILQADNPFTQQAQRCPLAEFPPALSAAAKHDLQALQRLYQCTGDDLSQWVQHHTHSAFPPVTWDAQSSVQRYVDNPHQPLRQQFAMAANWAEILEDLVAYYRHVGVGLFAQYRAFRWQAGTLTGIAHPDPIHLENLVGYELQQKALIQNTEALLAGYPALHVLLYGSRGSGKSSLVKALLHRYGDRGLRLIEVSKADLNALVTISDTLRHLPQKFILFVDDLSFEEEEDAYKALKVVLEGNLTARPQNLVVYATSNRRHLIREFFGDRPRPSDADEVHAWDTVQEKLSFSDRFGLTLTFEPADQTTYLAMVHHLANQAGITLADQELEYRALQWATRHNGRSGRSARQFVDFLMAELTLTSSG
ncbi:ATP-binding protein [Oscillatoria sp. FACHB-1407]|uniref:ATP-binding protein n=1 Tax=Oscillatoria sp. FACHB-1407 TaxID=2692847 RepID=UPI0016895643|nr:ATP-binding protein [Oscillatoria sp. FACHB-1407]MBD2462248.1 ATP-binding protein [Oscillatoria sp. FACHB-1407]